MKRRGRREREWEKDAKGVMELSVCLCWNVHTCQRKHVPSITNCTKCKYMKNFIFLIKMISATWYENKGGWWREGDLCHCVFSLWFSPPVFHCLNPKMLEDAGSEVPAGSEWRAGPAWISSGLVPSFPHLLKALPCSLELQGRRCWDPKHVRFV